MNDIDLVNRFTYHEPTEQSIPLFKPLRDQCLYLAHMINQSVPDGREKALAITKLEEVNMWANAGIARPNININTDKPS